MPMKMPAPDRAAARLLESLVADDPRFEIKKVFGHPAAFVRGHMCLGTFGPDVFLRLSGPDQKRARDLEGTRPFEPMAGRPMTGYLVLPKSVLSDAARGRDWVERSVKFTLGLPPKPPKAKH